MLAAITSRPRTLFGTGGNVGPVTRIATSAVATGVQPAVTLSFGGGVSRSATSATATGVQPSVTANIASSVMGSNGAVPIMLENPAFLANDAAFRARIWSGIPTYSNPALAGTASLGAAFYNDYTDGGNVDLMVWDATAGPGGTPGFIATFVGENLANSTPNPQFLAGIPAPLRCTRVWAARQIQWQVGWTNAGNADSAAGIAFNAGQGVGTKTGPWFGYASADGRAGVDMGNNTNYDIAVAPAYSGVAYGLIDSHDSDVVNEWTDGLYYDETWLIEHFLVGSVVWTSMVGWRKLSSDPISSYVRFGPRLTAPINHSVPDAGGLPLLGSWQWTNKNYNQSRKTALTRNHGVSAVWDADNPNNDGSGDPFNLLVLDANTTPFTPVSVSIVSTTSNTVVANVKLTRDYPYLDASYAAYLRPVVDGSDRADLDITLPYQQSEARIDGDVNAGIAPVSFSLPAGTYTIAMKAVSASGAQVSGASPTVSGVVVTGTSVATTSAVATAVQPSVTASGAITVTASVATASAVQPAVTATNAGTPIPVTSGLVLHLMADAGTSTTTDTAPLDSWTDQSGTAAVFSQTGSNRPTFAANAQNGLPGINFGGSQWLAAAGAVSAINGTDVSIFVWAKMASLSSTRRPLLSNRDQTTATKLGWDTQFDQNDRYRSGHGNTASYVDINSGSIDTSAHEMTVLGAATYTFIWGLYLDGVGQDGNSNVMVPQTTLAPTIGTFNDDPGTLTHVGQIYEIAVYNRVVDGTEQSDIESYGRTKWGTP